jgi:hypothetical protein
MFLVTTSSHTQFITLNRSKLTLLFVNPIEVRKDKEPLFQTNVRIIPGLVSKCDSKHLATIGAIFLS